MVRILVVDDDLIFGKSFTTILKDKGYNVEWVNSGNSAIAQLENKYFDIVFLDVKLPDINGAEVLKRVKAISPKTNVIMITAFSFDEFAEELIQSGAFAYFNKPFDISLAIRAIEELIE
jgi:DNA-binding NtrC family response regulator